jgi:hypothetical protein
MTEEFWFFFCYYLRIDKRCHENISSNTLNIWKSSIPWESELYIRSLQDHASRLSLKVADKNVIELKKDHDERVDEFEKLLDEFRDSDIRYGQDVKRYGR